MITPAERITFILTRGVVALALVGAGMFCISKGISFWAVPREEASQLGLDVLGLHLNAGGLGGVIFGAGIAICFLAYKTSPRSLESTGREIRPSGYGGIGGGGILSGATILKEYEFSDKALRVDPDFENKRRLPPPDPV
jgi:hypothetical protein